VKAFNEDTPFDRFLVEQVAGDLLPADKPGHRELAGRLFPTVAQSGNRVPEQADSLIELPEGAVPPQQGSPWISVKVGQGEDLIRFDLHPNENGRIATIVAPQFQAASFEDAEIRAGRAVAVFISQLSVQLNVPVRVAKAEFHELWTRNCKIGLTIPHHTMAYPALVHRQASGEFVFYASLYREALNSNSPVYQFLCLYKIVEGLLARTKKAKVQADKVPSVRRELLPIDDTSCVEWLTVLFGKYKWDEATLRHTIPPEVRGRKLTTPLTLTFARCGSGLLTPSWIAASPR